MIKYSRPSTWNMCFQSDAALKNGSKEMMRCLNSNGYFLFLHYCHQGTSTQTRTKLRILYLLIHTGLMIVNSSTCLSVWVWCCFMNNKNFAPLSGILLRAKGAYRHTSKITFGYSEAQIIIRKTVARRDLHCDFFGNFSCKGILFSWENSVAS